MEPTPPADEKPIVYTNGTDAVKPAAPKRKPARRKKKPKDALAPKLPLSGYNFFMRESRPGILERNLDASIQEITRKVALEWGSLTEEQRRPFLERGERDKGRYLLEMAEYKKNKPAEADTSTETIVPSKKSKSGEGKSKERETKDKTPEEPKGNGHVTLNGRSNGTNNLPSQSIGDLSKKRNGEYEVPIFTDEFLEHNKALDSELRTLRKSQTDYEQQNSILEKHVENMQNGVDRLTGETTALRDQNRILTNYLNKLRLKLVDCFTDLAIPTATGATLENIDQYMADLQKMATSNSHSHGLNKAKDIIRKTDLQIQLQ